MQLNHIILQYTFALCHSAELKTVTAYSNIMSIKHYIIQYVIILSNFQHIVDFFLIIIYLTFLDKHGKRWISLRTQTVQLVLIKSECTYLATNCLAAPKTTWSLCRIFRCLALHHRVNTQHGKCLSFLNTYRYTYLLI